MGQFLFTEIIKNRGNKDVNKESIARWIKVLSRGEVISV